jgi:hypothetical protein
VLCEVVVVAAVNIIILAFACQCHKVKWSQQLKVQICAGDIEIIFPTFNNIRMLPTSMPRRFEY